MKLLSGVLVAGFLILAGMQSANALSTVTIKAGSSVSVEAGESVEVRCERSRSERPRKKELLKADCMYNGTKYGEVVAYSDHAQKCENIYSISKPENFVNFGYTENVMCECIYNGTKYGEVIGSEDHAQQCKNIYSISKPLNCSKI